MKKLLWFLAGAATAAAAVLIVQEQRNEGDEWNTAWNNSGKPAMAID